MAHHNYRLEPNVRFSPDSKLIFFTSNMFGPSYIFAVEVEKAAAGAAMFSPLPSWGGNSLPILHPPPQTNKTRENYAPIRTSHPAIAPFSRRIYPLPQEVWPAVLAKIEACNIRNYFDFSS